MNKLEKTLKDAGYSPSQIVTVLTALEVLAGKIHRKHAGTRWIALAQQLVETA